MPSPLNDLTLTRAWGWGVAVLNEGPRDVDPHALVTTGPRGLAILVHHAHDVSVTEVADDEEVPLATARVHLRTFEGTATDLVESARPVLADTTIDVPDGTLSLGDAEHELTLAAPARRVRVLVTATACDPHGLDEVWVDVHPVADREVPAVTETKRRWWR